MASSEMAKDRLEAGKANMPITYDILKQNMQESGRPYDFEMIDRAYALAEKAHGGQRRGHGVALEHLDH